MTNLRNRGNSGAVEEKGAKSLPTRSEETPSSSGSNSQSNGKDIDHCGNKHGEQERNGSFDLTSLKDNYWLTRIVFVRYLAFIYAVAFLVAYHQNKQLIGRHGLLPADSFLNMVKSHFGGESSIFKAFMNLPTIFLFVDAKDIDWWLDTFSLAGCSLAVMIFITGGSNMVSLFVLWLIYHAIVNVGQRWYSFGWESQLLESGFLAIFFVPLFEIKALPTYRVPSWAVIWGNRWMVFRIMLGAGLIKIRGDKCWRDLTCMNYHYQTQPVPNPISYYLHQSPEFIHKLETLSNHFIELVAPVLLLLPRMFRIWGGVIQIFFQIVLIVSGNLSFLNWLTILPSIACFDDYALSSLFTNETLTKVFHLVKESESKARSYARHVYKSLDLMIFALIGILSYPVIQNLLSSQQAMNTSFDPFRLVNTYGAFGSVTKTRTEVIIQGTRNSTPIPDKFGGIWEEYEFKCKPGDVKRRPCLISPYHYRLDWLMWFSAFQNYQQNPWLIHLVAKLLVNDGNATSLIEHNPFAGGEPPRYIRGQHYKYQYTRLGSGSSNWWKRKLIGEYFPMVDLKSLKPYLKSRDWPVPRRN